MSSVPFPASFQNDSNLSPALRWNCFPSPSIIPQRQHQGLSDPVYLSTSLRCASLRIQGASFSGPQDCCPAFYPLSAAISISVLPVLIAHHPLLLTCPLLSLPPLPASYFYFLSFHQCLLISFPYSFHKALKILIIIFKFWLPKLLQLHSPIPMHLDLVVETVSYSPNHFLFPPEHISQPPWLSGMVTPLSLAQGMCSWRHCTNFSPICGSPVR